MIINHMISGQKSHEFNLKAIELTQLLYFFEIKLSLAKICKEKKNSYRKSGCVLYANQYYAMHVRTKNVDKKHSENADTSNVCDF